jgi:hypothetical protein
MPRRTNLLEREPLIKTKMRDFWDLVEQGTDEQVQRFGKELLVAFPKESAVLGACMRQDEPLCKIAYDQFMALNLTTNEDRIFAVPHKLREYAVEDYYEDAYQKALAFLDNHSDLSAAVLANFAATIESLSSRAMELLETRIPTLPRERLIDFIMHFGFDQRGTGYNDIRRVQAIAAKRLLDERPNSIVGSGLELRMFQMPAVRAQAVDRLFKHRFERKQWENALCLVPEKRKDAWEFALRNNAVNFEVWVHFIAHFEASEQQNNKLRTLSANDWDYLWSVGERIGITNDQWCKIAEGSQRFNVQATKKLVDADDLENLTIVVRCGKTQEARIEAARHLMRSNPNEAVLVKIISHVPSLRREAARKLLELPVV